MHILIADDNAINNLYLKTLLEQEGHKVLSVYDGKSAVESLKRLQPDIIFMDISMPVMDGITATARIRANGYTKPVIAITAHIYSDDLKKYKDAGMNDIVPKPFTKSAILEVLPPSKL